MRRATILAAALGWVVTLTAAADDAALKTTPLAKAFGAPPLMWGLKRGDNKDVKFVEYEHAEHSIRPERYRVDLLTELGDFLQQHLAAR